MDMSFKHFSTIMTADLFNEINWMFFIIKMVDEVMVFINPLSLFVLALYVFDRFTRLYFDLSP